MPAAKEKKKVLDLEKELAEAKKVIGMYISPHDKRLIDVGQVASKRKFINRSQ